MEQNFMSVQQPQSWSRSIDATTKLEHTAALTTKHLQPSFDFSEIASAVWRSRVLLLFWLLFCAALAAWYLSVTPSTYTASSMVILESRQVIGPSTSTLQSSTAQILDTGQAESQIQVIRSERILSAVFDILNLENDTSFVGQGPTIFDRLTTALGFVKNKSRETSDSRSLAFQAFSDRVNVRRLGQSYVLEVSFQSGSAEQAARISNAIAVQYIKAQIDVRAAATLQGTEYLRGRIVNIEAEQRAASDGVREGRIPDMLFSDADARIIGAALRPLSPSSPKRGLIYSFAIIFGLLTGLLATVIRHITTRTLNNRRQVRRIIQVECFGVLPKVASERIRKQGGPLPLARIAGNKPNSLFALRLRNIRTAIFLATPATGRRVIGVTSYNYNEGRSTVAANLAYILSTSSSSVELIDTDFENPNLTSVFAESSRIGLADLQFTDRHIETRIPLSPTLSFMPAGGIDRGEEFNFYLGSEQMAGLLKRLRTTCDVVLDLPCLSANSDALAVSKHLDAVVLVVEAGRTKIDEAIEAVRVLQAAHVPVVGVILNKGLLNV